MCIEFILGGKNILVRKEFDGNQRVLVQTNPPNLDAEIIKDRVFWDGWIKEEDAHKWTALGWSRTEIFATKFNQRGRWYDVPSFEVIKGLTFNAGPRLILKLLTRESIGKELDVQDRFVLTGERLLIPED